MSEQKHKFNVPTIFVIFGATGDLAKQKLFPALFDLYDKGFFPQKYYVVGVAHTAYDDTSFREYVRDILCRGGHEHKQESVNAFVKTLSYHRGSFDEPKMYDNLSSVLKDIDDTIGQCTNKLFHLAVAPQFYPSILQSLADTKLTEPCSAQTGWTRVLLEKPLGETVEEAMHVDNLLDALFRESQVYRIDHYLGKNTIQNILTFRFANALFDPVWNREYIDSVEINLFETDDVSERGVFYDRIGALRDVGLNHMLQILALIAMEHPQSLQEQSVRHSRARVVEYAHPEEKSLIRGQYDEYTDHDGVADDSQTETYFQFTARIDHERWHGVPFILTSGKALHEKKTEIIVTFKEARPCLCPGVGHGGACNKIVFAIQPEESIIVRFLARSQSLDAQTQVKDLSFSYDVHSEHEKIDAYEKILHDAIIGDQMLFRSSDEVRAAWRFGESIINTDTKLIIYKRGTQPNISV